MTARCATVVRKTRETDITVTVTLDGTGKAEISTGLRFLDHLLDGLTRHSRMDVTLSCTGDLDIDDHHTAEDCAMFRLVQGSAVCRGDPGEYREEATAHAMISSGAPQPAVTAKLNDVDPLAWLADVLPRLPGSGIVYTLTVAAAEEVATFLRARGMAAAALLMRCAAAG